MQWIKTEREKKDTKQLHMFLPQTRNSPVPLHFQGEFTKIKYLITTAHCKTSKRLQTTQAQLQEISYAQEQNQETSYAQAQLQETSIQIKLQRNLFEVEHLIYN